MLKPPEFWSSPDGAKHPLSMLLRPVASLYGWLGQRRLRNASPYHSSLPVICIGNVSMGGVGKTPFALALANIFSIEKTVTFLTRGYGGSEKGPLYVDEKSSPDQVGDEAILLARLAPTCVSANRAAGARFLERSVDAALIIMDDGFQNPQLRKDISILLVDAETQFGNGRVFPAGPLRETPQSARARTDAIVVVVADADTPIPPELREFAGELPLFRAWLEPKNIEGNDQPVLAFCGIGRPQKFYDSAARAGYVIVETRSFPDHHAFAREELDELLALAEEKGLELLTTEKDHVRLPVDVQSRVVTLPVEIKIEGAETLVQMLTPKLNKQQAEKVA